MSQDTVASDLLRQTVQIVSAFVSNNTIAPADIPALISETHAALASHAGGTHGGEKEQPKPAVPIRRSVTPDYIICLEDGKKLKMLKRHLKSVYGMTPEEYRAKWGLPPDYPMVAPNYAAKRSELAKRIGLGRKPSQ